MNREQARKIVLRAAAALLRDDIFAEATLSLAAERAPLSRADERRLQAEVERLAGYLEWEARGRRESSDERA